MELNNKIIVNISEKIWIHNLENYNKRFIVEKLLKKKELREGVIMKVIKNIEKIYEEKKTKLNNFYNKEIKDIKKLILNCKIFLEILNIKLDENNRIYIDKSNSSNIERINIKKKTELNYNKGYNYFYHKIKDFNKKIDLNEKKELKNRREELNEIINELNNHYKIKFNILKEKRKLLRKELDKKKREEEKYFFNSFLFKKKINNYIMKNNKNMIYNQEYIYHFNLKFWNIYNNYNNNNNVSIKNYVRLLNDIWFK